jgi:transposase
VVRVPAWPGHGRVHIAALACYRPGDRPRLIWRKHVWLRRPGQPKTFTWQHYRDLLRAAHRQLPGGQIVLIWDNLPRHRDRRLRPFLDGSDWLSTVWLPPYAPELNPVEGIWSSLKTTVLANLAPTGFDHLVTVARRGLRRLQHRPDILHGCLTATGLIITAMTN